MKLTIDVPAPSPEAVEAYLVSKGWARSTSPEWASANDGRWALYRHGGLAIESPLFRDAPEFDRWMGVFVADFAALEERPAADVLRDIQHALTVRTGEGARTT